MKVSLPALLVSQDGADAFRVEVETFVENVSKSVNKATQVTGFSSVDCLKVKVFRISQIRSFTTIATTSVREAV